MISHDESLSVMMSNLLDFDEICRNPMKTIRNEDSDRKFKAESDFVVHLGPEGQIKAKMQCPIGLTRPAP